MAMDMPGTLIVVEGIDGAGKSSLVQLLGKRLKTTHSPIVTTKEPGGTALGLELRTLLQHQPIPITPRAECLLFAADRAQHFVDVVIPALRDGAIVLSDRMGDSALAYQGYGRGHDLSIIQTLNTWTMHGIMPQITIYLKVPLRVAYTRMQGRKSKPTVFEQEDHSFMERVSHGFDKLYATPNPNVLILDATQSLDTLVTHATSFITDWLAAQKQK
jgi:dTMP kinase